MGMFDPIHPPKKHYHGPVSAEPEWPGFEECKCLYASGWNVFVEYNGKRLDGVVCADPTHGMYMAYMLNANGMNLLTAFSGHVEIILERRM